MGYAYTFSVKEIEEKEGRRKSWVSQLAQK
jgi:hypothetical protein